MSDKLTQNLTEATVVNSANDRVPIYSAASPSELRYMTPANLVPDASTTVKGRVELATDAEAAASTDTTRALTPSNGQSIVAGATVAATGKTTPVDADSMPIVDSAASNTLKELTWANLKATLLTWLRLSTTIIPVNAPQGFLINGRISVTVATNNLTVAIKTKAGADPSASDPVYCMIGDTVRSITNALFVNANAATGWMNLGGAEKAAIEQDLFVYLGYNATDGVVIGFSPINHARQYSDFSVTNTDEKFCRISTITNAVSTDYYDVIGRFAATLSAGAGFTWTVPTFTAINLIQRPIYETRGKTYTPVWVGFSVNPAYVVQWKLVGDQVFIYDGIENSSGTSNAASTTVTLPFKAKTTAYTKLIGILDNGTRAVGTCSNTATSNVLGLQKDLAGNNFTASGTKAANFQITYEI